MLYTCIVTVSLTFLADYEIVYLRRHNKDQSNLNMSMGLTFPEERLLTKCKVQLI